MFTHTLSKREKKTARTKKKIKFKIVPQGQGLPLSAQTNKNKIIIGCYQIEKQTKLKAPSDEGAVVLSNLKIFATVGTGLAPVRKKLIYNHIYGQPHIQPLLCKGRCRTNVRRRDCKVDFI